MGFRMTGGRFDINYRRGENDLVLGRETEHVS